MNNRDCSDINECLSMELNTCPGASVCINTYGSFFCIDGAKIMGENSTDSSGSSPVQTVQIDFSVLSGLSISAIVYTAVTILLMVGHLFFYRRYIHSYDDEDEYDDYVASK